MRNVYFVDNYKAEKNHGLNTYTTELGDALNALGVNLCYVWLNAPFEKKEGTHLFISKPVTSSNKSLYKEIAQLLVDESSKVQNPIFHFNWINQLPVAYYLKQLTNCTTILTKHCIPWRDLITNHFPTFKEINNAFETGAYFNFKDPKLQTEITFYDSVDHIITVTDCARKSLIQLFKIDSHKISKIANGLHAITPRLQKSKLREKYGFNKSDQLIIYAGNVNQRKGIFDVAKYLNPLFKKHPNLRLIVAGPGDHQGLLKKVNTSLGRVTVCGSLTKEMLYDFYFMADIGIIPSYVEQCSYTCIEMMRSGLPLVVSRVDGLKEMVNESCGLHMKVELHHNKAELNRRDVISNISFLLENPQKSKRLGNNAKKYSLQYFSAARMAEQTLEVYDKVCAEKKDTISYLPNSSKSDRPLVSIIIPCYNAVNYLQECLNSIYRQSFTDFEIILIDDGSSDATDKLIDKQTDTRIYSIKSKSNRGIAYCLNKAILKARGKYIARMDADDYMSPERLKLQVAFLEGNKQYGLVGSWHNIFQSNGIPFKRMEVPEEHEEIQLAMLFYNPISHPTVMLRKELLEANPYDLAYEKCEDYELWFRLMQTTKVKNLPMALVNYRIHQHSTLAQNRREMQVKVMELLSEQLDKIGIDHTSEDLTLHCAISFGLGKRFFNTSERIEQLNSWLNKIFNSNYISTRYTKIKVKKFRKHLLETVVN